MSKTIINELEINGEAYVLKGTESKAAENTEGLPYVVIRSRDAGCHAGYLKKDNETSVELINSRRLWYWKGALTLSEMAVKGVNREGCKFAVELPYIKIANYCEIISCNYKAMKSIKGVKEWTQ